MTAIADALTLSGRQLLRLRRYPSLTVTLIALPLVLLLVFTFVFGGTLGAGISGADIGRQGRAAYLDYIVPGLLLLALASAAQGTAITVAMDQTGGIITRLRTMGTPRPSILSAHVVAGLVQSLASSVPVALVAVALGWRPDARITGCAGSPTTSRPPRWWRRCVPPWPATPVAPPRWRRWPGAWASASSGWPGPGGRSTPPAAAHDAATGSRAARLPPCPTRPSTSATTTCRCSSAPRRSRA